MVLGNIIKVKTVLLVTVKVLRVTLNVLHAINKGLTVIKEL